MDKFYEKLNISENCLANQTIFKKTFLESVDLLASDKKLINDHIKKVIWKCCLKPDNTNISIYKDEEREYLEKRGLVLKILTKTSILFKSFISLP